MVIIAIYMAPKKFPVGFESIIPLLLKIITESVNNNTSFLDFFLADEQNNLIQNFDCYESMQCTICPIKFNISPGFSHTIKLAETIEF